MGNAYRILPDPNMQLFKLLQLLIKKRKIKKKIEGKKKEKKKKKKPQAYKRTRENAMGLFSHLMEE